MSENEKKTGTWKKLSRVAKISIILLVVASLALGVTLAKYIWERVSDNAEMTSDPFYFTVDLLGDSEMIESKTEAGHYSFADSQSGAWNLYSGTAHTVSLKVQNFADELRVTKSQITYTATVTVASPDGTEASINGLTLKNGEAEITGNQTIGNTSGGSDTDTLTLSIPAHSTSNDYKDGTKVTVTIKSTAPYEKIITLDFVLYTMETGLFYKIVDAPNTPYAELILINALSQEVQPKLIWCEGLSIDNTNSLTYTRGENNSFVQQTVTEDENSGKYEMQISRVLKVRESVSIYFFKSDPTKVYTMEKTEAPQSGGTYTIEIKETSEPTQPSTNA